MAFAQKRSSPAFLDWDFRGADTREYAHCFHDYPARMIPQIAARLLEMYGNDAKRLLDPYCGTGTSLVEAQLRGIDSFGFDINPLACLIAKVKTTPLRKQLLNLYCKDFSEFVFHARFDELKDIVVLPNFPNVAFWFQERTIVELAHLKRYIQQIEDDDVQDFFKVAFSETVRECSLTRVGEFKLYRIPEHKRAAFAPDTFGTMERKLARNREGMFAYLQLLNSSKRRGGVSVLCMSATDRTPLTDGIYYDIVITSPPYGDSHTTVAYGQYSRLSSEWLDFSNAQNVDRRLMGGIIGGSITYFDCEPLDDAINRINVIDEKRSREITSFYVDLETSVTHVSTLLRRGGYACYVVGNRKVKGVTLPTNTAIVSFFAKHNFSHVGTFIRNIPNKRMPSKNSPSNVTGKQENTMLYEYVVVMRKG